MMAPNVYFSIAPIFALIEGLTAVPVMVRVIVRLDKGVGFVLG